MAIIKKEAKIYISRLYCDDCNVEMNSSNIVMMSNPPQFTYTCPKCGKKLVLNEQFPKQELKEINSNSIDDNCVEVDVE